MADIPNLVDDKKKAVLFVVQSFGVTGLINTANRAHTRSPAEPAEKAVL